MHYTTQQLNSKCIGQQMSSSSPKLVIESNVVLFVSGEIISKRCWRSVKNGCDHLPAAWAVYKRGLAMKPASQQAYNLIADSKVKSVTRAVIMFQLLTILLAVTAVVTKAAPLTSHYEQPSSFQQFNVQTGKKIVDLGNISTPVYIADLFTNISNKRPEQNQVLSNDDRVNVVRSFLNLVTGEYCGPAGC